MTIWDKLLVSNEYMRQEKLIYSNVRLRVIIIPHVKWVEIITIMQYL